MKNWDYARHSHVVKQYGGPYEYEKKLIQYSVANTNKKWLTKILPAAILLVPLAAKGVYDIVQENVMKPSIEPESEFASETMIENEENENTNHEGDSIC